MGKYQPWEIPQLYERYTKTPQRKDRASNGETKPVVEQILSSGFRKPLHFPKRKGSVRGPRRSDKKIRPTPVLDWAEMIKNIGPLTK